MRCYRKCSTRSQFLQLPQQNLKQYPTGPKRLMQISRFRPTVNLKSTTYKCSSHSTIQKIDVTETRDKMLNPNPQTPTSNVLSTPIPSPKTLQTPLNSTAHQKNKPMTEHQIRAIYLLSMRRRSKRAELSSRRYLGGTTR